LFRNKKALIQSSYREPTMRKETNVQKLIENLRDDPEGFGVAVTNLDVLTLQQLIDKADNAYYRPGQDQIMEDSEYDLLRPALKTIAPDDERVTRVGAPYDVSELRNKVEHPIPMGSLDNTDDMIAGYQPWLEKVSDKVKVKPDNVGVMASLKVDGGSIRARYEDGKLVQVATRGNGEVGEDITANGVSFRYLPSVLPEPLTMDVRGEAVLYVDDYKAIKERDEGIPFDQIQERDRSNPRNIGNGVFGRDDGQDAEKLRFLAFNVEFEDADYTTEESKYQFLKSMGFKVVPHKLCLSIQDLLDFYNSTADGRDKLPFEIDGVVVCLNVFDQQELFITKDIKSRLRPKFARAIKFPHKASTTVLESVTISHGHTGSIVPTANLKEVRIGGVNVTSALLNNWDEIERLGVQLGDEVEVILAGDIIPKVIRVVKKGANRQPITEPARCPACGEVTTRDLRGEKGAVTFCSQRSQCPPAKMGKIDHWIGTQKKGVGILGIGDTILKTLWDEQIIEDAADLYTMTIIQIQDLEMDGGVRIGESRASKIIQETIDKSTMSLSTFLGSLGINLLGRRRVQQLQEAANGELDTLTQWLDLEKWKTIKIPGLGTAIRESIIDGLTENSALIDKLISNGVKIEYPKKPDVDANADLPFSGMSFCLTGTRAFQDEIVELGGVLKSGVSKTLTFLVQKDPLSTSNKTRKAESYGVKVIGIDYLEKAVKGEVTLEPNGELRPDAEPVSKSGKPKTKSEKKVDNSDVDDLAAELTG
jgi:DNA ligase (NAD+)